MSEATMPAALRFLLAARRCELQGLESLVQTCELVVLISELVHALQKERGYSNLYLGGLVGRLAELEGLSAEAVQVEQRLCAHLEQLETDSAGTADKARLFNHIAAVLYALGEVPALRRRIREQQLSAHEATATFTRLIGGLLAVVVEAADSALDPELTRSLVALFNFMQGKELAGQERASGVAGFSIGFFDETQQAHMGQLLDGQQRCFATFLEYASPEAATVWQALLASEDEAQVQQMRLMAARTSTQARVAPGLAKLWFELCSGRIDAMKTVEQQLAEALLRQGRQGIAAASADLDNHRTLLKRLAVAGTPSPLLFSVQGHSLDGAPEDGLGTHLSRSVLDLLQAQTQRLHAVSEELNEARRSLAERKRIEQAKRLLMRQYHLSEQAAHDHLQRAAMDRQQRLIEVADQLLALALE